MSLEMVNSEELKEIILGLDAWLETARGEEGYGGPVPHWWQNCLAFTGAGLDWRYEGIIIGYTHLYQAAGENIWLEKAKRAGDDLIRGQYRSGNFKNSSFERNPYPKGTPHEAAASMGLLHLVEVLKEENDASWETYLKAVGENLSGFYDTLLFDENAGVYKDHDGAFSFAPNKASTLSEALLFFLQLGGGNERMEKRVESTLDKIANLQMQSSPTEGAIPQAMLRGGTVDKYFPYYISRCVPGLLAGYQHFGKQSYLDAAVRAFEFVSSRQDPDGGFPQVVYANRKVNCWPRWIAPVGDILRAGLLLRPYGLDLDLQAGLDWLLAGRLENGAFKTAEGFEAQITQRRKIMLPDFRDILPTAGWLDKAFRLFCGMAKETSLQGLKPAEGAFDRPVSLECRWRGAGAVYHENQKHIELRWEERVLYRWEKGEDWAAVFEPEMALR